MASVTNGLKGIQRVSSVISRAIEYCFAEAKLLKVVIQYDGSEYTLVISAEIYSRAYLNINVKNASPDKCVSIAIEQTISTLKKTIEELKSEEKVLKQDVLKYGRGFQESSAVTLSSVLMFNQIIDSIKSK